MGNPWLFSRTLAYLKTGELPPIPTQTEVVSTAIEHLRMVDKPYIREMRKHIAWYTKGMHSSAEIRRLVNKVDTANEMEGLLRSLL